MYDFIEPDEGREEQLSHGMNWSSHDNMIDITHDPISGTLEITLLLNNTDTITLYLTVCHNSKVIIDDLQGNGSHTPHHNKGYGTLLFNIAIQILHYIYAYDSQRFSGLRVVGNINHSDSPLSSGEKSKDVDKRRHFWKSFGFTLKKRSDGSEPMRATLSQLRRCNRGMTSNGIDTMLDLSHFYPRLNREE